MPKTDKVEYERRLIVIQGWLIEGSQYALILKSIMDQGWCQKREAERMIAKARARWIDFEDDSLEKRRKFKIQELKHKIRSMDAAHRKTPKGLQVILNYEKEIIKLEGLSSTQKIQLSGDEEKPIPIKHIPSDIDYTMLSDEVLLQIAMARKPMDEEA